ncbi:hypothetical protein ACIA6D_42915 [Streptomyces cacaoi]
MAAPVLRSLRPARRAGRARCGGRDLRPTARGDLGADARATLMVGDNPVRDGGAAACGLRTYILPADTAPASAA